ncbi:MAG: hypothetical protein NUV98_02875 [Candidatus Roizmanbacteria bacterium]|nr:hypothetical protein [Candidatus Roizmanbacteria bacterium]
MTDDEKHAYIIWHESFKSYAADGQAPPLLSDVWVKFPYSKWHTMRLLRDYPAVQNLQLEDVPPYEHVRILAELFQDTATAAVSLVNNPDTSVSEAVIAVNGKRNKSFGPFHQHFIGIDPDDWTPVAPDALSVCVPHRFDLLTHNNG